MQTKDLRSTVGKASKGDREAAAALFREFHPRVYRYALGKLRNGPHAEDAAAETFAKVIVELKRFRWRGGGFEPWLFRIASNVVMDHFRRTGMERPAGEPEEAVEATGPPEALIEREEAQRLTMMVDELAPDQREVILLRFAAGLSCEETARVMGRSSNTVRQIQFRAMKRLRSMAEELEVLP